MTGDGANDQPITGINVTPLVDITLVLLIIFMVTAKLIVSHQALPVELPPARTGMGVQDILSLVVLPSGAIRIDGRSFGSDADLIEHVRRARAEQRELRAVIQADGAVPHRRVMHVLDLLRQSGISRIGFGVVPAPARAPG